jgi:hypothetical protein
MKQSISCPERGNKGNLMTSHEANKKERLPYPHAASHHIKKRERREIKKRARGEAEITTLGLRLSTATLGAAMAAEAPRKERERFSSKQR